MSKLSFQEKVLRKDFLKLKNDKFNFLEILKSI